MRFPTLGGVARLCARHPLVVMVVWLLLAAGALLGARSAGTGFADDFDLPDSQAARGMELLSDAGSDPAGWSSVQVVLHHRTDEIQLHKAEVGAAIADLEASESVADVADPFAAPGSVSPDRSTAIVTIELTEPLGDSSDAEIDDLEAALEPLRADGIAVEYSGALGERIDGSDRGHHGPEAVGLIAAALVLLAFFRSALRALVPIVSALVAVGLGLGILGLLATQVGFPSASPALAGMIGLGTGIDYGLLLTTRASRLVADGLAPREATVRAVETSGPAAIVGAMSVGVALASLFVSGVPFVGRLGLAAMCTVLTALAASLTFVPALVVALGRQMDRWSLGVPKAEPVVGDGSLWVRHARRVTTSPWPWLVSALVVLALLAAPAAWLNTGVVEDGSPGAGTADRARDLVVEHFGAGATAPLVVVLDAEGLAPEVAQRWSEGLRGALVVEPGVASVSPVSPVGGAGVWSMTVTPVHPVSDQRTEYLVDRLVDTVIPGSWDAEWGKPRSAYLTGVPAAQLEFGELLADRLPWIVAVVLLAAVVVLTVAFRAPVVALKAAALNLLSVGAAYGVLVVVFQWQWGSQVVGIDAPVQVEAYVPMLMFVIVFGLSMDYEVFLLSRVREIWHSRRDGVGAVEEGLAATGRVISAAALIMICVFLSFTGQDDVSVKMLAIGLATSVAVDATLVRLVLVPATMTLLGSSNWWEPRWLRALMRG